MELTNHMSKNFIKTLDRLRRVCYNALVTKKSARSSGDRAPASGAGSAGSIPAGRTIGNSKDSAIKVEPYFCLEAQKPGTICVKTKGIRLHPELPRLTWKVFCCL